mmetsp:Transcript_23540/g.65339  ORF Transcript_23540/g.65339 Transcript_23540/m.65339 type:complete len:289 (-) Transcript_23540:790-1656(-)
MGDHVLAGGVDVPSMGPCPQTEGDFFPHETPGCVRIKGHVDQKAGVGKEESGRNERDLRWPLGVGGSLSLRVDAKNVVFHGTVRKDGPAQSGPRSSTLVLSVVFLKAGRICRQDRFGIILGGLGFVDVEFIPVGGKLQVCIHLHKIGFSSPKLAGIETGRLRSECVRVVDVNGPDLSAVTILFVFWVFAEFFNAILVGRFGTDRGPISPVFVLSYHLQTGFADRSVEAKAVLNNGSKIEFAGILGLLKGTHQGLAEQVLTKGRERNIQGIVVANGKDGSTPVGVFEWL